MSEYLTSSFDEKERKFMAKYELLETLLGEGTYGKVYKAVQRSSRRAVAMKKMKLDSEEEGIPCTAIREIALLRELRHDNVVELLDVFCSPNKMFLVFEYLENDLKQYMKATAPVTSDPAEKGLPSGIVRDFTWQLLRGMEYCHSASVIHRDLKPQNLLVDAQLRLKIADFGLARIYSVPSHEYTHEVITVWYRAPEILLGSAAYSIPVDLWSVGCIAGEMASQAPLFGGDSEIDTIFKIFQKLGTPTVDVWPQLNDLPDWKPLFPKFPPKDWKTMRNFYYKLSDAGLDLLLKFLAYNPAARISARDALRHDYLKDLFTSAATVP